MKDKETQTEKATPRKREQMREEGHVASSKEVISVAVLVAAAAAFYMVIGRAGQGLLSSARSMLGQLDQWRLGGETTWLSGMVSTGAMFLIPVGFASVAAALFSGFSQTKGFFSLKPLKPKPNFLNPLPKLKRMFLSKEAVTNLLQSAGKVVVIAGFTFQYFWQEMRALVQVGSKTPVELLSHLGGVMLQLGIRVVALLIVFAAIDLVLQHRRMEKEMRMSKQEVKEEHKQSEGDPAVKRRQRQAAREMANRQMLGNVAQADVVVVNPTHYAVALAYDTAKMPAPQVTAKGKDALAAKIRDVARKNRVPVVHNPPLARSLHAEVKVGGLVPINLYGAVAELLAYVYRLRRRAA